MRNYVSVEWIARGKGSPSKAHIVENQGGREGRLYQGKRTLCGATVPDLLDASIGTGHTDFADCQRCRHNYRFKKTV